MTAKLDKQAIPAASLDVQSQRLLAAIQTFLIKLQAENGMQLSTENQGLLQRATAGIGWVRFQGANGDTGCAAEPSTPQRNALDLERDARARLLSCTSGHGLASGQPSSDVQRLAPTPQDLQAAILARTGRHVGIERVAPIWTETSKEIFAVRCKPAPDWPAEAILRREPPIAVVATSLVDEYDVLNLLHAEGLPVPRALFAEADPEVLGGRVLLLERVSGRTIDKSEIGDAGSAIAADMARFLAALHRIDPDRIARFRDAPGSIADRLAQNIAQARKACDAGERSALVETAFDWLDKNFAECVTDDPTIVHGDFDLRNILIDRGRVSAVLDWELSVCGNPAQDLGYTWPHITQISDWDQFMAVYIAAGGRSIPLKRVLFFAIWSQLWRIAVIVPLWRAFYASEHSVLLLGSLRYLEQQVYLEDLDRALALASAPHDECQ